MINAVDFESGEDEAFLEPILHVDLGEYILNANLLESKEFCKINIFCCKKNNEKRRCP